MSSNTKNMTHIALMTAVLCILSPLTVNIPISPVPISIANLVIYIFAIVLGTKKSLIGLCIYILIGAAGFPVFSKYASGIGYLLGPTGGYLLGFFSCSLFTSLAAEKTSKKLFLAAGMVIGTIICYIIGTVWLAYVNKMAFFPALFAGVIPFIPGDIAKIIISVLIGPKLKKQLKPYTYSERT